MDKEDLRIGDVVAVTARITGLRGDGTYSIEPVGFDFEVDESMETESPADVDFYTVDAPVLVRRGLMRGDEKFSGDGERYVYHEDLGSGLHLLNRPDTKQHLEGAWIILSTDHVKQLRDEPPSISEQFQELHNRQAPHSERGWTPD